MESATSADAIPADRWRYPDGSYDAATTEVRTFLFTDIEGSTRLLARLGEAYEDVLARHWKLVREPCELHGGEEFGAEGDAMFFAFPTAAEALSAAIEAQHALLGHDWGDCGPVLVRMALHSGEARSALGTWLGVAVHQAARACAAGHGGQVLVSADTAASLPDGARSLLRSLGEYNLRDIVGVQTIYQVVAPGLRHEFPPLRTPSARVTNLPDQATTFIGRVEEITDVRRLIATHRLVTIAGPGGAGKTRLALEVAGDAGPDFDDGVWVAELADLSDPAGVIAAVARAISAPEADVLAALEPKNLLLVIDNCEHVIDEVAAFATTVLARCPNVHLLATSREALAVPGEHRWMIPPLARADAVRLFADRATSARADFATDDSVATAVTKVVEELDAMPLAIELAAARSHVLTPTQILDRLHDRLGLLTSASRGLARRQQTLRALIDWSYDLLDAEEQRAFRRLSVFTSSFDIDAATAVLGDHALDLLDALVRKSLVVAGFSEGEPPRFWMLQSVRAYAAEALAASDEHVEAHACHAAYYLELSLKTGPELTGPNQVEWLDRVEVELENFRAAIVWLIDREPRDALRIAGLLAPFFGVRSRPREGRQLLELVLDASPLEATKDRIRALVAAGTLARLQADFAAARAHHEAQLTLARELGTDDEIARALSSLGNVELVEGNAAAARPLFEESLERRRRAGAPRGIALSLNNLGVLADSEGDYEAAGRYFEEHLAIMRELGDLRVVGHTLTNLGLVRVGQLDFDSAAALFEESITLMRQVGDTRSAAITLAHQAGLERRLGNHDASLAMAGESLRALDEVGDPIGVRMALEAVAAGLVARGHTDDVESAAQLLGAASLLPSGQAELGSVEAGSAESTAQAARRQLGDAAFDAAFARGAGGGQATAVALAAEIAR